MRYLWNMLNEEFTIEGAVSAFLVINMIGWMAATMGAGMLICKFLGFSITGNLENLMCAGIYGGLIVGLVGGSLYPVSYTHLDVYKRQCRYFGLAMFRHIFK